MGFYLKKILFYRDFVSPHGGHYKVADYFNHVSTFGAYQAAISFSATTKWDNNNPWGYLGSANVVDFIPEQYDYIFLAGMDWQVYLQTNPDWRKPVINLIQHVRHADPNEDVYQYLRYPGIRICVSNPVKSAILEAQSANGPVICIQNGLALPVIEVANREWDVFILGVKQPELAHDLYSNLSTSGLRVLLVSEWVERETLYRYMANSRVSILLPNKTEGFYLPAIESMNYSELTIVPDCVGNRGYCLNLKNCLMPKYDLNELLKAAFHAFEILSVPESRRLFATNARQTVESHSLSREREDFGKLMAQIDELWRDYPFAPV